MDRSTQYKSATEVGDWIEPLARVGYATKGFVYVLIGILAVQAAANAGGSAEGTRGAIQSIADEPFGQVLICLIAVGLFGYALWRITEALVDPRSEGSDKEGIAKRVGYAISGIIYLGLSAWSAWIVLGSGGGSASGSSGSGGGSQAEWTATMMAQPFGRWLVALVGAAIVATGLFHFKRAYQSSFMKKYRTGAMSSSQRRWAKRAGTIGLSARGVAFCLIGGFLIQAALQADPSETEGLAGALQTLGQQPYGPWLMGAVALGFVAYGVHCFALSRYSDFSV